MIRLRRPKWPWLLALGACAAGAAARLAQYLEARPLWLDESMLALNIAAHPLPELLQKHDYHQVAPPLFLVIERAAVVLAGVNELSLRAFPTLAGIAALPLICAAAWKLLGRTEALLAVWTGALATTLIRYSNELKPYSVDALVTAALLLALALVLERPERKRRWAALAACGAVAPALSIPSAFVIGAVLIALLARPGDRTALSRVLALALLWGAVGLAVYALSYRSTAENPFQHQGYAGAFLIPGEGFLVKLDRALEGTLLPGLSLYARGSPPSVAAALGALLGLALVRRRHGWSPAVALAGPILLAALASAVQRYPFGVPKMMVFSVPLVLLIASALVAGLGRALPRAGRLALFSLIGAALLWQGHRVLHWTLELPRRQDAPALLEDFRNRLRYDEPVYVAARGIPSWLFYTTRWDDPDRERLRFYAEAATWGPSFENAPSRGRPVENEGFDLVYQRRLRKELLGVSSGRQWRYPSWYDPEPDPGWARNEAERIVLEANPCFWMYFSQLSEFAHKPLMWELRGNWFAERRYQRYERGAVLWRYCLPKYGPKAEWIEARREEIRERTQSIRSAGSPNR